MVIKLKEYERPKKVKKEVKKIEKMPKEKQTFNLDYPVINAIFDDCKKQNISKSALINSILKEHYSKQVNKYYKEA